MAIKIQETSHGKVLEVQVSGKLGHSDYLLFLPKFQKMIAQNGTLRLLFEMVDFHGWEVTALWDDIKFDVDHFSDIERLAMVGEEKWERGMSVFCRPFIMAKIRYFDHTKIDQARAWLDGSITDDEPDENQSEPAE